MIFLHRLAQQWTVRNAKETKFGTKVA